MPDELQEILSRASPIQIRWVMARLVAKTDAEAARRVGLTPPTVCQWENKAELDRAVNLLLQNAAMSALAMLEQGLIKAAGVLLDGLDASDPWVRLRSAEAIWSKAGPRPIERREVTRRELVVKLWARGEPEPPD